MSSTILAATRASWRARALRITRPSSGLSWPISFRASSCIGHFLSLFESRFCTSGQAHEKGLTEGVVGSSRRNRLVPAVECASYEDFNADLLEKCRGVRRVFGEVSPVLIWPLSLFSQ
ncbi:MAG TPA: hypothetical protein DEP84_36575 [Chloroflexi bacterium]|nr:hypothetical protein [Chloroflexota bacterium]